MSGVVRRRSREARAFFACETTLRPFEIHLACPINLSTVLPGLREASSFFRLVSADFNSDFSLFT